LNSITGFLKRVLTPRSSRHWHIQFTQHLLTGAIATAAHYVVMWLALSAQLSPAVATSVGFIVGAATRFLFSYYHVFEPGKGAAATVPHFILALGLQMLVNAGLLTVFLSMSLPVWPSQVLTTVLLTIFNFLIQKYWVFK